MIIGVKCNPVYRPEIKVKSPMTNVFFCCSMSSITVFVSCNP